MNDYIRAGWRIAESAREGSSIDAIIDQHENELVEFMGKLGIAREILKAEGGSSLRCPEGRHDELNLDNCKKSWLPRLGRLVVENRKIGSLREVFDNLTIITFNYDRCIEHYLPFSLESHYGIALQEARELVAALRIFHPFGTVGRLPWQVGPSPVVEFGAADRADLVSVSKQIRTFTEQLEDAETLDAMRVAIYQAQRIVFIGFAYHRPNLALIRPDDTTHARSIFGTVKGISEQDRKVVQQELGATLGLPVDYIGLLDMTCSQLFDENWRALTS